MTTNQERNASLPIRHNLTLIYAFSLVIAILMAAASLAGLMYSTSIYPTNELLRTFVPNDVVNLSVGLPVLLGSMWLAQRGKLIGLLCWPGALLFVLYNYIAYVFALPLNMMFLLHLTLVMLSVYTTIGLVVCLDGSSMHTSLAGAVHERAAGGVLVGLGLLFSLRAVGVVAYALFTGAPIAETELAVNTSDFLIAPASVIGGTLLWRHRELGYVIGLGLLFQTSMLFIALIIFLLVQPFLTAMPFALVDVVVISIMGLISFIPLFLFVRGAVSKRNPSST